MLLRDFLLVAAGGALGAMARHGSNILCVSVLGERFPWGTLVANVLGCFLLGLLLHHSTQASNTTKLILGTGVLGAFTTFSTFGVQTLQAWQRAPGLAFANVGSNVILGLGAAGLGVFLAAKWSG